MIRAVRLTVLGLIALALPVQAAVFRVTHTADALDGACDLDCSLREAVQASNGTPEHDVIVLGPGVYVLTRPGAHEDGGMTGDLDVRGVLVILGEGPDRTVLDGNGLDRVLDVHFPGSLDLHRVTVRNGSVSVSPVPFTPTYGGGIRADRLTLVESVVTANRTDSYGGGVSGPVLTLRDSTVSGNEAGLAGGGIFAWGTFRAANLTVSGNRAGEEGGGGLLLVAYDQELTQVTVTGNTSAGPGGGISAAIFECPQSDFLCQEKIILSRSIVAGNTGGLDLPDCISLPETTAAGFNLFGVGEGCGQGIQDRAGSLAAPLDPKLSSLGDHGGATPTHLPLPGSPARDAAGEVCPGSDQRGAVRPADGDGDGQALCDAGAVEVSAACLPGGAALCLQNGRFRVTAAWKTSQAQGAARALPLTADTGAFWFFEPDNLELTVKVLDGCGVNQRFWVFLTGLTDVGVEVLVEDTKTGETWTHTHAAGTPLQPRLDTNALEVCP